MAIKGQATDSRSAKRKRLRLVPRKKNLQKQAVSASESTDGERVLDRPIPHRRQYDLELRIRDRTARVVVAIILEAVDERLLKQNVQRWRKGKEDDGRRLEEYWRGSRDRSSILEANAASRCAVSG